MSAIFGILKKDGTPVKEELLKEMQDSLLPYGRDDQQIFVCENAGFGSCINHLNEKINRDLPVISDNQFRTVLVADAQIYNRDELIDKYSLCSDRQISNNGLLLSAYRKWGQDCAKYIRGDFAFAVYDYVQQKLFLAVDHLAVRPLYYYSDESVFVFATDDRAILSLGFIPKKINEVSLYQLLSQKFSLEATETNFANLYKLPQAHVLIAEKDSVVVKTKYWTPGENGKIQYYTETEYSTALREIVEESIRIRMESIPDYVGAELSGGLDSSVISIYAGRYLKQKGRDLALFSWSPSFEAYPEQPRDERKLIRKVCEQEQLTCNFSSREIREDIDGPSSDATTSILQDEMAFMTTNKVRTVLSGWGGDQAISHRANLSELYTNGYRKHFYQEIRHYSGGSFLKSGKLILSYTLRPVLQKIVDRFRKDETQLDFMQRDFRKRMQKYVKPSALEYNRDLLKHLESGNIQTRTYSTAKIGAENCIQFVFPYLDYRVVDFAFSIPRHLFFKNRMNRYVYRKAFEDILPQEVCYYMPKDDIAKLTYYSGIQEKKSRQQQIRTDDIRRDVFGDYIDFEKLHLMIASPKTENTNRTLKKIDRKLDECRKIQEYF